MDGERVTHRYTEDRKKGIRDRRFSKTLDSKHIDEMGYVAEWRVAYELGIWKEAAKQIDGPDRGYDLDHRGRRLEVKWVAYDDLKAIVVSTPRPKADILVFVFGKEHLAGKGWLWAKEVVTYPFITHRNGVKLPGPGGHDVPVADLKDMYSLRRLAER